MDNNDTLKEIAERTMVEMESNHSDLKGSLFRNVIKQDYLLPALTEAYNLGIPVSVKEYAVEVLRKLHCDLRELHDEYVKHDSAACNGIHHSMAFIQNTITQIKANPSGNIGIHKWIPVEEKLPEIDETNAYRQNQKVSKDVWTYGEWGEGLRGRYLHALEEWQLDGVRSSEPINVAFWMPLPPSPDSK